MPFGLAPLIASTGPAGQRKDDGVLNADVGAGRIRAEPRLSILIVEDEVLTADYLRHLLTDLGYEVCGHAASAAAALRMAEAHRPGLVLMDINLGRGGDGIAAAREIFERYGVHSLFVTAYGDRATLTRAESAHPAGVILKPVGRERLHAALVAARARLGRCDG